MKLAGNIRKVLGWTALGITLCGIAFVFNALGQKTPETAAQKSPLLGRWKSSEATIDIRADASIKINDEEYAYKVKGSIITVISPEGTVNFPFVLDGDTLTVDYQGRKVVYSRMKGKAADDDENAGKSGESIIPALVGTWCYQANLTGNNSYASRRCFTLNANGTYRYDSDYSQAGAYGGTSSQSSDSGRWTATRTTITAYSTKNGKIVYPIQLRNHPKTGDAMIILDGAAYVTATQRRPW